MALDTTALLFGALVLASFAVVFVGMKRILATPTPKMEATPSSDQRLVARKVYNEQMTAIGESVRVTASDVVVKAQGKFLLVPRSHIQEYGPDIICDDGIDWKQAEERGEAWRKEHEDTLRFDDKGMMVLDR
ncbi:MAG: hypothetical protein LC624_11785 [Halobacteriales archaeon]|nr:hypothetical protein [Halobacteriales archaeon]